MRVHSIEGRMEERTKGVTVYRERRGKSMYRHRHVERVTGGEMGGEVIEMWEDNRNVGRECHYQ